MAPADDSEALAIIGGTEETGKWAVRAALQRGRKVRVLCRTPGNLKAMYEALWSPACPDDLAYDEVVKSGKLTVVKGSLPVGEAAVARDEQLAALRELVAGASQVLSFLVMNPNNKQPVCRPAIEALMEACEESEPHILIMCSVIVPDSGAGGKAAWGSRGFVGSCMRWRLLRKVWDDGQAAEAYMRENKRAMGLGTMALKAPGLGDWKSYFEDCSEESAPCHTARKVRMDAAWRCLVECFMDAMSHKEGTVLV